ncbi:MAG: hypothetical protein HYZ65_13815 [Burkholderiales bacterium]|nr:hypothetical protein [Burkholderiales bacterium]
MESKLEQLALRRQALLLKSQAQRNLVRLYGKEIKQSLGWADLAWDVCGKVGAAVQRRPAIGAAVLAGILLLKPRRAISLSKSALNAWQLWQKLAPLLQRFQNRASGREQTDQTDQTL